MSDGMTDRRSQEEPLLSTSQVLKLTDEIRKKLQIKFLTHPDFAEFKVKDVRALASDVTDFCMNELVGLKK
jgi:hypothetical protein